MVSFVTITQTYLAEISKIYRTGVSTEELSYYGPLRDLFNAIGSTLSPAVSCVEQPRGVNRPDFLLYAEGDSKDGDAAARGRGMVEVKGWKHGINELIKSPQVVTYWESYNRRIIATNLRQFVVIGEDHEGHRKELESFSIAGSDDGFEQCLRLPGEYARQIGVQFGEFLARAFSYKTRIRDLKDLAQILASYAREGLARMETSELDLESSQLSDELGKIIGVDFQGELGGQFFRSTLIQTLVYGVFSAWVLWSRQQESSGAGPLFAGHHPTGGFAWRDAADHLHAPALSDLFNYISQRRQLHHLGGLGDILDWTQEALMRVEAEHFFNRITREDVVVYFYETFINSFDPAIRAELGVWYTPKEIVRYMVARVDQVLKRDFGIVRGLADDSVFVLDPCCGTGAYLTEVLHVIRASLSEELGHDLTTVARLKEAAASRIFGFDIMPVPVIVAHLQIGLALRNDGIALDPQDATDRLGIFLTNSLTGWEERPQISSLFTELAKDRERADEIKQSTPILVILGNPPYEGFTTLRIEGEEGRLKTYREAKDPRIRPEGRGLNDLYVKFFRIAERRIAEGTGRGIVCFVSNNSWLEGFSHPVMRDHFLKTFDKIWIDNLHGNRRARELGSDGKPSQTVFAMEHSGATGIEVGVAITLLSKVHRSNGSRQAEVFYRSFDQSRADNRKAALLRSVQEPDGYTAIEPDAESRMVFTPVNSLKAVYQQWPSLIDIFRFRSPGIKTSRDEFLVDIDEDRLRRRVEEYFDPDTSNDEIAQRYPRIMESGKGFDARAEREALVRRGHPREEGFVPYEWRPFDQRWLYWEEHGKLLDRNRARYVSKFLTGTPCLVLARSSSRKRPFPPVVFSLSCMHLDAQGGSVFPLYVAGDLLNGNQKEPNLKQEALEYITRLDVTVEDLFGFIVATLYDKEYRSTYTRSLRLDWPRIPLPGWGESQDSTQAGKELLAKADKGARLIRLLKSPGRIRGVTSWATPEFRPIALMKTENEKPVQGDDFKVTAPWGKRNRRGFSVSSGKTERFNYEGMHSDVLGPYAYRIYINDNAYWDNIPERVWQFNMGGHEVLPKWLSARDFRFFNRPLTYHETDHFSHTARRIAAILLGVAGVRYGQ
ncbi:MAG: N-6 DNA methylase [Bacteroidota bacterium]|nr:N-6 DNA methylase [Bacteroidota bacterium]